MMAFAANKNYENKIIELCYLNILLLALKVKRECLLSFIIYIYICICIYERNFTMYALLFKTQFSIVLKLSLVEKRVCILMIIINLN